MVFVVSFEHFMTFRRTVVSRLSMSWSHGAPLWLIWHMLSEGVDRKEAIPIVPKASHDTGYTVYLLQGV